MESFPKQYSYPFFEICMSTPLTIIYSQLNQQIKNILFGSPLCRSYPSPEIFEQVLEEFPHLPVKLLSTLFCMPLMSGISADPGGIE
jgi:hypothetical protein